MYSSLHPRRPLNLFILVIGISTHVRQYAHAIPKSSNLFAPLAIVPHCSDTDTCCVKVFEDWIGAYNRAELETSTTRKYSKKPEVWIVPIEATLPVPRAVPGLAEFSCRDTTTKMRAIAAFGVNVRESGRWRMQCDVKLKRLIFLDVKSQWVKAQDDRTIAKCVDHHIHEEQQFEVQTGTTECTDTSQANLDATASDDGLLQAFLEDFLFGVPDEPQSGSTGDADYISYTALTPGAKTTQVFDRPSLQIPRSSGRTGYRVCAHRARGYTNVKLTLAVLPAIHSGWSY